MAVGHYTRKSVAAILRTDDAIDPETWEEYAEAGYDESKLKITGEPTRWHLRRVSYACREQLRSFKVSGRLVEWATLAFRAGLDRVDGYEARGDGGRVMALPPLVHEQDKELGPLVPSKWLDESGIPIDLQFAIGALVEQLSEGNVPFVKDSSTPPSPGESETNQSSPTASEPPGE